MLMASYRTVTGAVRHIHVLGPAPNGDWLVLDAGASDRRRIEVLSAAMDGRDQAVAIASDYAEQAQRARRPLVRAAKRRREAVAA